MLEVVEGADEDKDHLLVEVGDVVPDAEDDGTELAGDGNGVLGVHHLVLVAFAFSHQFPVDHAGLNNAGKFDQKLTVGELCVAEVGKRRIELTRLVDPVKQVLLSLGTNEPDVVLAHELPDHGQDVLLDAVADVLRANADHLDADLLHGILSHVTVVVAVEHVLGLQVSLAQVTTVFVDAMANAQNDKTVTNLLVEVLDEAVRDLEGVDPHAMGALLAGASNIVVDDACGLELLLGQLLQAVLLVKDGCDEDRVYLRVALNQVLSTDAVLNTHGGGVVDGLSGTLNIVSLLKSVKGAVSTVELVEHVEQLLAVLEVTS